MGTRAKGLEGSMGNLRFAVRGESASEPHLARAAALRDAQEFGMVGLLDDLGRRCVIGSQRRACG